MKRVVYWSLSCCVVGGALVLYMDRLNELTRLRVDIPHHVKELRNIQEENERMQYEIDQFENPVYLMDLLKKPEFSHLKFPRDDQVIIMERSPS